MRGSRPREGATVRGLDSLVPPLLRVGTIPILIVATTTALSPRLSAISAIEVVFDPHEGAGSRHQLRHVPWDLSSYRFEKSLVRAPSMIALMASLSSNPSTL